MEAKSRKSVSLVIKVTKIAGKKTVDFTIKSLVYGFEQVNIPYNASTRMKDRDPLNIALGPKYI